MKRNVSQNVLLGLVCVYSVKMARNFQLITLCVFCQAHLHIDDLFSDLADGKMLMKLLEIISGENLGRPNKGVLRVQKIENVNRSLQFLSTKVSPFLLSSVSPGECLSAQDVPIWCLSGK